MDLAQLMQKADTMTAKIETKANNPEPLKVDEPTPIKANEPEPTKAKEKPVERTKLSESEKQERREQAEAKAREILYKFDSLKSLGLTVELSGTWFWVSGDTKPHKETIKALQIDGYKCGFSKSKQLWYFSPIGYRKRSRKTWSKDEIDEKFDSKEL